MVERPLFQTAVTVLAMVLVPGLAAAGAPEDDGEGHRIVVGFESPTESVAEGDRIDGYPVVFPSPEGHFAVVRAQEAETALRDLADEPGISYAERDRVVRTGAVTPNDPLWSEQYGPQQVEAPSAWEHRLDGDHAVCVVDTGVRYSHEDLAGDRWMGGYDYANDDDDPWDDHGHGTHTTGIAAAGIDNGAGVAGTGNVPFYHMKALDHFGTGYHSWIAAAMRDCADEGDVVLSMSHGGSPSSTLEDAVEDVWQDGDLLVASAGNDGPCHSCIHYPASYPEVVAVTCTDGDEDVCSFSSTGPEAEVAAPGDDVLSTAQPRDTAYTEMSGTSMSAPRVAGGAALLWSWFPSRTNAEVRQLLQESAQDLGPDGRDDGFGHGELDLAQAVGPSPPEAFEVQSVGPGEVRLTWDPPADPGEWSIGGYEVFRGHPGDPLQRVAVLQAGVTSYVDGGNHLLEPQEYRYTVRATNPVEGPTAPVQCEGGQPWGDALEAPAKTLCQAGADRRTPVSVRVFADTATGGNDAAVSGAGDASGTVAASGTGGASGVVAISGTGTADGSLVEVSGCETSHLATGTTLACLDGLEQGELLP